SPDFDLFSDQEEYSEEEVAKTMEKIMEQYMSKTRADYGSGVARPKIEDKDNFELKGQFLKELRTNTFSGSDHEDANEHIKKVLEIVDEDLKTKFLSKYCAPAHTAKKMEEINNFQQEPDENLYQAWERFKELLMKCPQHHLTEMQEVVLFYNGLDVPTRQILDSRGAIPSKTVVDAKELADINVPLILERPFLSIAHAKIDVFKRKITLRVGEEKIIFKSVKPASSLIKRVYMLSLRERMELDLEARLMGETLVLNRSLDPLFGDYIELNDLNVPLELRRDQVADLMPTIEEVEVVEEFRARNDARMVSKFFGYPSDCDHDKKIRIDCAHNLKFSCMIGFEFLHANFFHIVYVNVMSKKFYNSIRKDKLEYKGNNVVGALMNIPIFVGTFSILTDFAVLKDMDAYHDEGMGDVIFGEPFFREVGINARRFEGMITIYNGNTKWRDHIRGLNITLINNATRSRHY
ncbi:putative reverse transcriptase domain-containing protein, partial [Tanacetum coccineum]